MYCQYSDVCDFENGGCSHECRRLSSDSATGGGNGAGGNGTGAGGDGTGATTSMEAGASGVTVGDVIGRCYCPNGMALGKDMKTCISEQQR